MIMFFGSVIIVMLIGITKKTSTVVLSVIFAETAATKMIPLWIMLRVSALTAERLLQTKKQRYAQNVSRDVSRRQKSGLRKQERL